VLYDLERIRHYYRKLLERKSRDYYERFDQYLLERRPLVRDLVEKAFARLFPDKVGHLLDVGCGTCFYFPLLAQRAERITGVDLCIPMLEQAQELIKARQLDNCEVREASALDLPFAENSIDVVLSWDFLHHVPRVAKAINEIARVLRPGGRYIALEPNLLNPSILWYHLRRRVEWGLMSKNQFFLPRLLRQYFQVKVRYDNTIISYLSPRTRPIWKAVDLLTSIPVLHLLSFRYILECKRKE
jgi:ubiquinone/menaquinone biosynthesis C-methylase UbiE